MNVHTARLRNIPYETVFTTINIILVIQFVANIALSPIVVDKMHIEDTMLLTDLAWRGIHGFRSVVDFPNFYGGLIQDILVLSADMFGFSFKSIDYSFIIMFVLASFSIIVVAWRRLRTFNTILLITLSAALILSRTDLSRSMDLDLTHSVSYNHVSICLMLSVAIFSLNVSDSKVVEIFSAIIIGTIIYMLVLFKTTFFIIYFGSIISCSIQRRWSSIIYITAGVLIGMLIFDFGGTRAIGSFHTLITGSAAQGTSVANRLSALYRISTAAIVPIFITMCIMIYLSYNGKLRVPYVYSTFPIFISYAIAALTMFGFGLLLLPMIIAITISISNNLESTSFEARMCRCVSLIFSYGIIVPATLASLYALYLSILYNGHTLISDAPARNYFVHGKATEFLRFITRDDDRLNYAVSNTCKRIKSGSRIDDSDLYVILADGVKLLKKVDNVENMGIVSNSRAFHFPSALGTKVVNSFQIWPTPGLPMMSEHSKFGSDVDIVMIGHQNDDQLLDNDIYPLMGDGFSLCAQSQLWSLYVRKESSPSVCNIKYDSDVDCTLTGR